MSIERRNPWENHSTERLEEQLDVLLARAGAAVAAGFAVFWKLDTPITITVPILFGACCFGIVYAGLHRAAQIELERRK